MKSRHKVSRNFLALGSGEVISRLIAFAATVFVARILGADGSGVIAFAVGANLYFGRIADFAIEWVGAKEVAKHRDSFNDLAEAITGIRLLLAGTVAILAIISSQVFLPAPENDILSLYLLSMLPIAANTKWVHMGLENAKPIGFSRVLGESVALIIILLIMTTAAELWVPPLALLSSEILMASYLYYVLHRQGHRFGLSLHLKAALPIFKAALPVLVNLLLGLLIYNSDLIFLRLFRDSTSVGYYAAAYMLISFINNLGLSYAMSLLPTLTRLASEPDEEQSLYHTALAHMYAICFPIAVGGFLLAAPIIELGFGESYSESVFILQVLMWSVPLSMIRNVPWAGLIARGKQDLMMKAILYAAISNIALNLVLIPPYGMLGAAIAAVATELVAGYFMHHYAAREGLTFIPPGRIWLATVSGTAMAVAIIALDVGNLFVNILLGSAVYICVLTLFGGISFKKRQLPHLNV